MSSADDPSGETRYSPLLDQSTLLDPNLRDDGGDSSTPPANEKFPKRIPGACEHCRESELHLIVVHIAKTHDDARFNPRIEEAQMRGYETLQTLSERWLGL